MTSQAPTTVRPALPSREFWDAPDLSAKMGVHPVTLRRWVQAGRFPAPVYLMPTKPVWRDSDYRAFCDELEAQRDARSGLGEAA